MLNAYNGKLRRYLVDNHYMETLAFHTIPGSTIIDTFGYRECPRQKKLTATIKPRPTSPAG